jgi:hypothetical protein
MRQRNLQNIFVVLLNLFANNFSGYSGPLNSQDLESLNYLFEQVASPIPLSYFHIEESQVRSGGVCFGVHTPNEAVKASLVTIAKPFTLGKTIFYRYFVSFLRDGNQIDPNERIEILYSEYFVRFRIPELRDVAGEIKHLINSPSRAQLHFRYLSSSHEKFILMKYSALEPGYICPGSKVSCSVYEAKYVQPNDPIRVCYLKE